MDRQYWMGMVGKVQDGKEVQNYPDPDYCVASNYPKPEPTPRIADNSSRNQSSSPTQSSSSIQSSPPAASWSPFITGIHWSGLVPLTVDVGYSFGFGDTTTFPLGFQIGFLGFYVTMNLAPLPDWLGYPRSTVSFYDKNDDFDGRREEQIWDTVFGFSFNAIDELLSIPVGLGWRSILEYRLFGGVWMPAGKESVVFPDDTVKDPKRYFLFEIGINVKPIKWLRLTATYRWVHSQGSGFFIGTGISISEMINFMIY